MLFFLGLSRDGSTEKRIFIERDVLTVVRKVKTYHKLMFMYLCHSPWFVYLHHILP